MFRAIDRRRRHSQTGFTLIELLVVIVILGVLSAVVVFAVRGVGDKGASSAYATDAKTVRTAQEAFCAKFGRYGSEAELVSPPDGGKGFLSEQSNYHATAPSAGGPCSGSGDAAKSGFTLTCNVAEEGCGAGGALPTGGTLVVGETFARPPTNVASNTNGSNHAWWEIMYNGLLTLDEAGNASPELATEVPTIGNGGITNGGATYTLHLRNDVFWHDSGVVAPTNPTGAVRQFTADDVKFTFEKELLRLHARTRNMAAPLGYDAANCVANNIVVLDPFTVQFNFINPYAPFLKQLNVTEAPMNPKHVLPASPACPAQATADAINVGTGPFKFDSINNPQNGDGKVVKNQNYWRPGLPILDAIIMRPFPDTNPAARTAALLNGEVDYIWDTPNPDVASFQANSAFEVAATQSLGGGPNSVDTFIFNLKASGSSVASVADGSAPDHPILGDLNVRKAMFHGMNRDDYLNLGRNGIGTVSKAPVSSQIFGHATDLTLPPFDVAAANALLDAAHWNGTPRVSLPGSPNTRVSLGHPSFPDGTPLTIRFLQGSAIFTDRVSVMDSNMAAIGINLDVSLNTTNANTVVFTNRNFDTYILNYAAGYDPHVGVRRTYHSDQIGTVAVTNAAGYRNASVDAAFDTAVTTLDPGVRFGLYHDFQEQVVADLPYIWMIETPNVRSFTAQCTGFKVWTGLFAESASCHR